MPTKKLLSITNLKKYFPVLKDACLFAVDMSCEMDGGYLGICPTTVPERRFFAPKPQSLLNQQKLRKNITLFRLKRVGYFTPPPYSILG